jgi:HK97 gp10 family phage protein
MAKVVVSVAGLSELGKNLATFAKEVKGKVLRKAAREAAYEVRDAARAIVVAKGLVRTGRMKNAIAARRQPKASRQAGYEQYAVGVFKLKKSAKTGKAYAYANTRRNRGAGRVGKGYEVDAPEFYWKFLEFGTVNMAAKPFLVPAFESRKQSAPDVMAKHLRDGMEAATRKLVRTQRLRQGR